MDDKRRISLVIARSVGARLGLDWTQIDLDQFRRGLEIELELAWHDSKTNITSDDVLLTGRIVWIHLKRIPDYYTRLERDEVEVTNQSKPRTHRTGRLLHVGY